MKTFEQQVANALRTLTVSISVLAVVMVATCGLATWGLVSARSDASRISQQQAALKAAVQSPTHGKDIAIWCGFDQSIEADLLAYIGQFHGHVPALKLPSLDCAQIEAGEAASSKTKP